MTLVEWPHAHLCQALVEYIIQCETDAREHVSVRVPRVRTYPLVTVQEAGLGDLGMDSAIQADEIRVQVDSWSERRDMALAIAQQVFVLMDSRFGSLRATELTVTDGEDQTVTYRCKIERSRRSGGGDPWFDEIARLWRVTTFYSVKVNL